MINPAPTATTTAAERPNPVGPIRQPTAGLHDIVLDISDKRLELRGRHVLLGVLVGMFVVVPLIALGVNIYLRLTRPLKILFAALIVAILIGLLVQYSRRRSRKVQVLLQTLPTMPPEQWLLDALSARSRFSIDVLLEPFLHALIESGRVGRTFRIAGDKHLKPVQPIDVYFEPRPLDETADTFADFVAAIDSPPDAPTSQSNEHPVARAERRTFNKLNIHVRKAGGWFGLILGSLFFLRQAMDWIRFGRVNFMLMFWLVIMIGWLLRLTGTSIRTPVQWFLVPGGIVSRALPRRAREWTVSLLDRRSSVLCVYRSTKHMWIATVADHAGCWFSPCTENEATLLLRAWLSPLEPPKLEQLSDLM